MPAVSRATLIVPVLIVAAMLLAGCSGGGADGNNPAGANGSSTGGNGAAAQPYAKLGVENPDGICPVTGQRIATTDYIVLDPLKRKWLVSSAEAAAEFMDDPSLFIEFAAPGTPGDNAQSSRHAHGQTRHRQRQRQRQRR